MRLQPPHEIGCQRCLTAEQMRAAADVER